MRLVKTPFALDRHAGEPTIFLEREWAKSFNNTILMVRGFILNSQASDNLIPIGDYHLLSVL